MHKKRIFYSVFFLLILSAFIFNNSAAGQKSDENSITIAVIGPMTGKSASKGKNMVRGMRIKIDQINEKGGINGKKINLVIFDDQNSKKIAREKAREIVEKSGALIVLGHRNSDICMAAGEIYKEAKIPIITGTATADGITVGNPWYFRVVPNNARQGIILAYFAKKILNYSEMSIIYDEDDYGMSLRNAFEETALKIGIKIHHKWGFHSKQKDLDIHIKGIVEDLSQKENPGPIFLATHDVETVPIIKYMKVYGIDLPMIGGASVGKQSFCKRFDAFPLEKKNPGYYTDGIYASTYFIYDVANVKAQQFRHDFNKRYNRDPGASSVSSYDVAATAVEAAKRAGITGDIKKDRKNIRDQLAGMDTIENAFNGITGHIFFDHEGNAVKPLSIGMFYNQKLISAPVQLNQITNLNALARLKKESEAGKIEEKDILQLDDTYLQMTKVVYAGTDIVEIKELDFEKLTFFLDFYLWFRFQGDLDTGGFTFVNALEPIKIENPVTEKITDQGIYRLYRVKGYFKADFMPHSTADHHQHVLGFSLYHRDLPREKLIIVGDVLNMGLTSGENLSEKMKTDLVLSAASGWSVENVMFFQDIIKKSALGNPESVMLKKKSVEFSKFNTEISVKKNELAVRGVLPFNLAVILTFISSITLLVSYILRKKKPSSRIFKPLWFLQSLSIVILCITLEVILIKEFVGKDYYFLKVITMSFDIAWWFILAMLSVSAINNFLWIPLEEKTGRTVPSIVNRFFIFLFYMIALSGIIAFVFDQKITSLLATSGLIAMIIGLAVQINLSNIFSGLAINLENPFRIGDWVKVGEIEGRVVDITWRSTRLRTGLANIISIPNSTAAESVIHNWNLPENNCWHGFKVHVDPSHPPERVIKVLTDAVSSEPRVMEPWVLFLGISDWAADYGVYGHIKDYGRNRTDLKESFWKNIWTHLNNAGIPPIIQRQEICMIPTPEGAGKRKAEPLDYIQTLKIFEAFSGEAKAFISSRMELRQVPGGESVYRQGDQGDSMFILAEGVVGMRTDREEGETGEVVRKVPGDSFGEETLVAGRPRTESVFTLTDSALYEISIKNIAPLFKKDPALTELIGKNLVRFFIEKNPGKSESEMEGLQKKIFMEINDVYHDIGIDS